MFNKVTKEDLAWLGGIIDGEGCLGFHQNRREGDRIWAQPSLRIANTDELMLKKASRIIKFYSKNEVDYYKIERKGIEKDGCIRKDYFSIGLKRLEDLRNLLVDVLPYLTTKAQKAEEFIDYCNHRLKNFREGRHFRPYDNYELLFIQRFIKRKIEGVGPSKI